jgi:hypothetical protein
MHAAVEVLLDYNNGNGVFDVVRAKETIKLTSSFVSHQLRVGT